MTTPRDDDEEGYEVGYGKPPTRTRFQSGRSGNPKGRPKGSKNLKTDLREELGELILVREGDTAKHVTKQRAMVKALMAKALKGDVRAVAQINAMSLRPSDEPDGSPRTIADLVRRAARSNPREDKEENR